jgi:hypothetical protein
MPFDESTSGTRHRTEPERRDTLGMIRHMAVKLTSDPAWQCVGHLLLDNVTREQAAAHCFSNIGFYSRPKAGRNVESIVAHVGGAQNPVIVATRDEDTRSKVAEIGEDETAVFTTQLKVVLSNDGTISAMLPNGVAVPLALKLDLTILRTALQGAVIAAGGGGANAVVVAADAAATAAVAALVPPRAPSTPPWPIGTAVFKAQ